MSKTFELEPLDVDKLVKYNELAPITNPVFFNKFGQPNSDGLLSNEIFGITKDDRSETYAYIDLGEYFISPHFYKAWFRVDSNVEACINQTNTFVIGSDGKLVPDPKGSNGIEFLRKNFGKFKWKKNNSFSHNTDIRYLSTFKENVVFINKFPVIPPYYRDIQTSSGKRADVGILNKLYNTLLLACKALKDSSDYGLTLSGSIRGRIQSAMNEIYNWLGEEPQIGKKFGILRRANMAKTTDYSTRLVMTAPKLNVERLEDMNVDPDHAAIPMASLAINFYPFVLFHMRRFFENEFSGRTTYFVTDYNKEYELDNYLLYYSDDELKKQIDRFVKGFSNRFIKVEVPVKNSKTPIYMRFTGKHVSEEDAVDILFHGKPMDIVKSTIVNRYYTWCDIIYQAVCKAVEDKMILFTRYPIDSYYNQIPLKINVSSTMETEPVIINGHLYNKYPLIRDKLIGTDTSNYFIDTMNLFNPYLKSIGGDYDGDTGSVKGIYTDEANEELQNQLKMPLHWIGLDGNLAILAHAQAIDAVYAMTLGVPDMKKLTDPEF